MGRFRVFMIGSSHPLTIELSAEGIDGLGNMAHYGRFLEGEIVDDHEDGGPFRVLIPLSRIHMIAEAA